MGRLIHIPTFICQLCGKPFERYASQHHVFCSKVCHNKSLERKVEKVCPVCQKIFSIPQCYVQRYNVCSMECRLAFTRYHNCDFCGKHFTARPHKIRFCSLSCYRRYLGSKGETSLESMTRSVLMQLQVTYEQEVKIGRYSVDFLLPQFRLIIECDGAHWHRNHRRDTRKNRYIKSQGFRLLRLDEVSIKEGKAKTKIDAIIHNLNFVLV